MQDFVAPIVTNSSNTSCLAGVSAHPQNPAAAFVLHSWPWRESSLIVELLSVSHGRIAAIVKGARRPHSPVRGLLQPFLPLTIKISGKSEVKTLGKIQLLPPALELPVQHLPAALYANEVTLALVPRGVPDDASFAAYADCISELLHRPTAELALRRLEKRLLVASGYAPAFDQAADGMIQPDQTYALVEGKGWIATTSSDRKILSISSINAHDTDGFSIKGTTLLDIANEKFDSDNPSSLGAGRSATKQVLHYLMRRIAPQAGSKSRQSWRELSALTHYLPKKTQADDSAGSLAGANI